jgi:hypothetical protein
MKRFWQRTIRKTLAQSKSTHSDRLERWFGTEHIERLSQSMKSWYGPPISVHGVRGRVYATGDGDFIGPIHGGSEMSAIDAGLDIIRRERTRMRTAYAHAFKQTGMAGFTSLSDLIAEATSGKVRNWQWSRAGSTGVVAVTNSLWGLGPQPAAGADGSAAPGGRALTDATGGAMPLDNVSTDTRHIVSAYGVASVAGNNLLLYDRLFDVLKTMNSTTDESVTGVPTRYQSSTTTAADYAGGNFAFVEVGGTALAATAHNWQGQYRNQAGTDAQSFPAMAGNSGAIVRRLDHPVSSWFMPLNAADVGVMDLAVIDCSAAVATGVINWVIGHPIAWVPCPVANLVQPYDYIDGPFNLERIFDDAALAWLEVAKPATTATTYNMGVTAVHG